jgi:hypothetical protein
MVVLYDKHIYFRQSRAKKKEIIADSKIAKELLKRIPYGSTFEKAYGYVIFQTWVGWIYRRRAAGNGAVYEQ